MMLRLDSTSPAIRPTCSPGAIPDRERAMTARPTTLARLGLAFALALAAACGGGHHTDTYRAATSQQEACCEHLAGAPRDQCLAEIVRVDDERVAQSRENQRSYACVQRHFRCDAATGRATAESNQAQLDCIQDLGE